MRNHVEVELDVECPLEFLNEENKLMKSGWNQKN